MNIPRKTKQQTLFLTLSVLIISWIVGYLFLEYQFNDSINKQFQRLSNSTLRLFELKIVHEKKDIGQQLIKLISTEGFAQSIADTDYKRLKVSVNSKDIDKLSRFV